MNSTQPFYLSVPLGKDAHRWAKQFAAEQATPEKEKRVYLNTLAVYAVHSYLKWLTVETALSQSDSWHPGLRAIFDVADLVLPNVGKLECRPVLPDETALVLPAEVTQDRIGYVAVQFNQELDSVQLLGFASAEATTQASDTLQISELQSLDALIDQIYQLKPKTLLVNLRQWIEGVFNEDWQSADWVLASNLRSTMNLTHQELAPEPSTISRAKEIDWKMHQVGIVLALVVQLTPKAEDVDICLRLYPSSDVAHLPPDLQLAVLDEAGKVCMEAQARSADSWIQLEFSCNPEERFSLRVVLGEISMTEEFVV